jgi:hypothetical protein
VSKEQTLEKGKPPERVGRKVPDLSLKKDRVAELPGNFRALQKILKQIKWR